MNAPALAKKIAKIYKLAGYLVLERGKQPYDVGKFVWLLVIKRPTDEKVVGFVDIWTDGSITCRGSGEPPYTPAENRRELEAVLQK